MINHGERRSFLFSLIIIFIVNVMFVSGMIGIGGAYRDVVVIDVFVFVCLFVFDGCVGVCVGGVFSSECHHCVMSIKAS